MKNRTNQSSFYIPPLLLALLIICMMTPFMGRRDGYTVDANANFYLTKEIVQSGTLFPDIPVKQGYIYSLAFLPFYLFGRLLYQIYPTIPADSYSRACMCWMNIVFMGLTVGMISLTIKELKFSLRSQMIVPLLYGLSTFAFAYARYDYNKTMAAFLLISSFFFLVRYTNNPQNTRPILFSGILLGLLITLRLEMSVVLPFFLYHFYTIRKNNRTFTRSLVLFLFPFLCGILFVIGYNQHFWQGGLKGGYETGFGYNPFPAIIGFLFSPGKSLFLFNPILLLFPLLLRNFRDHCAIFFRVWLGLVISLFLLYSFWGNWWGGWGFGPRHLVPLMPLLILPLSIGIDFGSRRFQWFILALGGIGVVVQWLGSAVVFSDVIYTLMNAGITEYQLIWNPLWCPILQHARFLLVLPFHGWDYAVIAWYENLPLRFFIFFGFLWVFCMSFSLLKLKKYINVTSSSHL